MASGDTPTFPQALREALSASGTSVRGLARLLAGEGASDQEVDGERRSLGRYLKGQHTPTRANADRIAQALALEPGSLPAVEDASLTRRSIPEQLDELADLIDELRSFVEERLPAEEEAVPPRSVAVRLRELEATVETQGAATTTALKALTAGIRRLERQLAAEAPRATKGRAAR